MEVVRTPESISRWASPVEDEGGMEPVDRVLRGQPPGDQTWVRGVAWTGSAGQVGDALHKMSIDTPVFEKLSLELASACVYICYHEFKVTFHSDIISNWKSYEIGTPIYPVLNILSHLLYYSLSLLRPLFSLSISLSLFFF